MSTNFLNKLKTAGKRREKTVEVVIVEKDEEEEIEEVKVKFTVRDMTGNMRDYWDSDAKKRVQFKGKNPDLNTLRTEGQRALLVAMTLVDDETGELAFDFKNSNDLNQIGELSGALLDAIFDESLSLCGLNPKSNKETEGNSEETPA